MIERTVNYLNGKLKFEIIIVNDGSTDNTWGVINNLMQKFPDISGVHYKKNAGKGYAVTSGMMFTRGELVLMADADGATDIADFIKLRDAIDMGASIAIGSRNISNEGVNRSLLRDFLGQFNTFYVRYLVGIRGIEDTQCGFKLFARKAAKDIFLHLHLVRWAFDVEILYLSQVLKYQVVEIPVSFTDVAGSKLNVFTASISFIRDYTAIIIFYNTGYWNLPIIE